MPDAATVKGFPSTDDIAAKLVGLEDAQPPSKPATIPASEAAQEPAEPDTSAESEPPGQAVPVPGAPPVKIKIKVDGEEVEMTRADVAKQIETLLAGDKDDFGKVASFTGYLNKKSIALSDERKKFEASKSGERQQIAEQYFQEYLMSQHGDKAPEVLRQIAALLNPQTSATSGLQTSPTSATIKLPEGVDENDPYWQAIKATQTEASALRSQLANATRQLEEMAKGQKEAQTRSYVAQVRAEYDAASKVLPILQDELYADIARSKVYGLVKDGGLDMATAATRVAKELQEREDSRITKYLEGRKAAAKAAPKKPDAAGPALSKPKPFSFKDDPDEMERRIAMRLAETEE